MNFEQSREFQKELKRLQKKWRSLPNDLNAAEKAIKSLFVEPDDAKDTNLAEYRAAFFSGRAATILSQKSNCELIKMRLYSTDLKSNNKVRLIFVAVISEKRIMFVEIYSKSNKDSHDVARASGYFDNFS